MRKLLTFFALVICVNAFAQTDPIRKWWYSTDPGRYETPQAACSGYAAHSTSLVNSCSRWPPNTTGAWSGSYAVKTPPTESNTSCTITLTRSYCSNGNPIAPSDYVVSALNSEYACPSGSEMKDGKCMPSLNCPAGTHQVVAKCVPDHMCQGYPSLSDACDAQGVGSASYGARVGAEATCTYPDGTTKAINCDNVGGVPEPDPDGGETDPDTENKTCPPGTVLLGYDGDGNARCKGLETPPDPCPAGTHNIGSAGDVNCTANEPPKEKTTETTEKKPEVTTTGEDGSQTKVNEETKTNADGSTQTTRTTTVTSSSGAITTTTETACKDKDGKTIECAGGGGGGGGGGTEDKSEPIKMSGDLYAKTGKTFAGVMDAFKQKVEAAPAVAGAKNFLMLQVPQAGCPAWVVTVEYFATSIDVGQYFCSPFARDMLDLLSIGVMVAAAYAAFRIAFL